MTKVGEEGGEKLVAMSSGRQEEHCGEVGEEDVGGCGGVHDDGGGDTNDELTGGRCYYRCLPMQRKKGRVVVC